MNYEKALASLDKLEAHGIFLGLDRIRRLLKELGDPHHRFRSIHIAGTNGKGSTASYIVSVLKESGYRTGLYTSPHLNRFTERITISGEEIPHEKVAHYTEKLFDIIHSSGPDFKPTYFEVTTAMAFAYFAEELVDFAVIETGLGGRLDATNVVIPEISLITNVALEHTDYLGETIEEIAREKGGIIKTGVDIITGEVDPRVLKVLQEICEKQGSRLVRADHEIRAGQITKDPSRGSRTFDFRGEAARWDGVSIALLGPFQVRNALLALGALESLIRKGVSIPEAALRRGLSNARWPGRMEVISHDPFVMVDGAHNPHAAEALLTALEEDLDYRRLILVIGILQDKDIPAVVNPLIPYAAHLVLTKPENTRGSDPHLLSKTIQQPGLKVWVKDRIPEAVDFAGSLYEKGDLILVTGSLYTVGEARGYLLGE